MIKGVVEKISARRFNGITCISTKIKDVTLLFFSTNINLSTIEEIYTKKSEVRFKGVKYQEESKRYLIVKQILY